MSKVSTHSVAEGELFVIVEARELAEIKKLVLQPRKESSVEK